MAVQKLDFGAAVDAWTKKTQQRMVAVFRTAAEYTFEDVMMRTPVDTGYLRASFTATLDAPLPMRGSKGDGYTAPPISLTIAGADIGDTIFGSFVANYAGHVEYGARGRPPRAMVRGAAQAWQGHVDKAVAEAKSRVK